MDTFGIYSQAQSPQERARLITARMGVGESIAESPARYLMVRKPFNPSHYDAYLDMYGTVYGDMSDPDKRADTVRALRRRDASVLASARRQLRENVANTPTDELHHELTVKRYQIEQCPDRPWNVRNADIHTYRMIINELRRRSR